FDAVLSLTYLVDADAYLFDDTASGYSTPCAIKLFNRMKELETESVVIYLTDIRMHQGVDMKGDQFFMDGKYWLGWIEGLRWKHSQTDEDEENKSITDTKE
ncbi:MAG: hypothetical protein GY940_24900, partial [bacterium]|nr:hypothetical protein [bacterium]